MREIDLIWSGCIFWNLETDNNVFQEYVDSQSSPLLIFINHSIRVKYCE